MDFNSMLPTQGGLLPNQTDSLSATGLDQLPQVGLEPPDPYQNKARLLEIFNTFKKEAMEYRWVWEREWLRDLYYIGNRQWIFYHPTRREWVDKRLQKWVPRPVTNKMAETLQAIRTNLAAINLAVVARPVGHDTESIAAAEVADNMSPLIHEEHDMNQVMREADFWLIATGNAVLQISWSNDVRFNRSFIQYEQCVMCGQTYDPQQLVQAHNMCPSCGSTNFVEAKNPDGTPMGQWAAFGKGSTCALSPFEYAFPPNVIKWDDLPYIIRLRWREKHWFEANHPELIPKLKFEKSPSDRSLQLFKSLALTNDIGTGSNFSYLGSSGSHTVEGITEYELWMKPTKEFPKGLVMRVIGENEPIVLDLPEESLPGPFPYTDIQKNPVFPFVHAQYEHVGGRLLGRSAISPLIQKQDQLNQLDSLIQLSIQRMANPVWVVPEGAGIDHFSGEPGLVIKWNPLAAGGTTAKPDRLDGQNVPGSLWTLREQILKDIEDLSGAFDIIKGQKPSGIEAFSALQLLVERSQSRFTSVFQARGEMYRKWFSVAIELERQFGPEQRVWAVVEPNRGYSFSHFENAQLQGQINFIVEDGSNMPKTALGKRAAIEQANQLGLINPADPDQRYALLSNFGLTDLAPSLNFHVQAALQVQDEFERWTEMPQGPPPLVVKPWFDPQIHLTERIKWLNTDKIRELLKTNPALEMIVTQHLMELQMLVAQQMAQQAMAEQGPGQQQQGPGQKKPGGASRSMANSNQNSESTSNVPHGNNQMAQKQGPA